MTDVNGAEIDTKYDALGRAIQQKDILKGLQSDTAFNWDATQSVGGPSGFNGVATGAPITGVVGVTLPSAYSVTTTATVQPAVTTYYDRLGRVIRTVKDGDLAQKTVTDLAYNNLGQTIATSLPYLQNTPPSSVLWTKTTHDPLGRVATVTAPNLTSPPRTASPSPSPTASPRSGSFACFAVATIPPHSCQIVHGHPNQRNRISYRTFFHQRRFVRLLRTPLMSRATAEPAHPFGCWSLSSIARDCGSAKRWPCVVATSIFAKPVFGLDPAKAGFGGFRSGAT